MLPATIPDAGVVQELKSLHELAVQLRTDAVSKAGVAIMAHAQCGRKILELRRVVPADMWVSWTESHCPWMEKDDEERYVKIAERIGDGGSLSNQTIRQAYLWSGLYPEPDREEGRERTHNPLLGFWSFTRKLENWVPEVAKDGDAKKRLREWWTKIGRVCGFINEG